MSNTSNKKTAAKTNGSDNDTIANTVLKEKPIVLNCFRCSNCLKLQKEEEDLMRLSCLCDLKICYLCKASIIRTNGRCPFCGVKIFQSADFASLK